MFAKIEIETIVVFVLNLDVKYSCFYADVWAKYGNVDFLVINKKN